MSDLAITSSPLRSSAAPDPRRARREWLMLGVVLLALAAFVAWSRFSAYRAIEMQERARLEVQARAIDENLSRQVYGAWRALESVREDRHYLLSNESVASRASRRGPCGALNLHQSTPFPRVPSADVPADPATPADLAPLLGTYAMAAAKIEMAVRFQEGGLVLDIKGQGVVGLTAPDGQGLRTFSDDPGAKVSFVRDGSGKATALKIHRTFTLPRKAD